MITLWMSLIDSIHSHIYQSNIGFYPTDVRHQSLFQRGIVVTVSQSHIKINTTNDNNKIQHKVNYNF